jgi:hypothetical protein
LFQRGSRTTPEHSSPDCELRWSSLRGKGTPERSSSGVIEDAGENSSLGNPAPGGNPGLKHIRICAILKNFYTKMIIK